MYLDLVARLSLVMSSPFLLNLHMFFSMSSLKEVLSSSNAILIYVELTILLLLLLDTLLERGEYTDCMTRTFKLCAMGCEVPGSPHCGGTEHSVSVFFFVSFLKACKV